MDKKAFNGRFVDNEGMSAADLERGYSMTGAIPETGESISNAQAEADKEAKVADKKMKGFSKGEKDLYAEVSQLKVRDKREK